MKQYVKSEMVSQQEKAERLFSLSPLKQEKFKALRSLLTDCSFEGLSCLDVGSDNGVISLMLRKLGGNWSSTDLSEDTVRLIENLVGGVVRKTDGLTLPFSDSSFDVVVIVDLLEHVYTDKEFIAEVYRVLRPSGILIANVPDPTEGILRRIRFALGQTDEKHGHLRPGYNERALQQLCSPYFLEEQKKRYVGFFASLIDTAIGLGLSMKGIGKGGVKGRVVDAQEVGGKDSSFQILKVVQPFFKSAIFLDRILPLMRGQMLAMRFRKVELAENL